MPLTVESPSSKLAGCAGDGATGRVTCRRCPNTWACWASRSDSPDNSSQHPNATRAQAPVSTTKIEDLATDFMSIRSPGGAAPRARHTRFLAQVRNPTSLAVAVGQTIPPLLPIQSRNHHRTTIAVQLRRTLISGTRNSTGADHALSPNRTSRTKTASVRRFLAGRGFWLDYRIEANKGCPVRLLR
jgi:hypothetical protein